MESMMGFGAGAAPANYYASEMQHAKMANVPTLRQRLDLAVAQAEEKLAAVGRCETRTRAIRKES